MFHYALTAAAQGVEEQRELPIPPWAFGLLALGGFFVLFLFTWSFRSVASKQGSMQRQDMRH
jgi:hypothetical protein